MTNKICSICGSNKKVQNYEGNLYCGKHYLQMFRHGKILERTIYSPNDFKIINNEVEITIYNRKYEPIAITTILLKHFDKVKNYKWSLTKDGYVFTYLNNSYIYLHRLIIDAKNGDYVDHINHNKLDNRDENLRICTNAQNLQNHNKLPSNNKSGYIGVCWCTTKRKWKAEIQFNKKKLHIGYFDNIEDAVKARIVAEEKYHKDFKSNINNIIMEEKYENN